jgi:hypothetical protein
MQADLLPWLAALGAWAWRIGVALALVLNAVAVAAVAVTRSRALVNRWTSPWLAANLALLSLAAGVPLVTALVRLALSALPSFGPAVTQLPK